MLIFYSKVNWNTRIKSNPFDIIYLANKKSRNISEKYRNYKKSSKIDNYNFIQLNCFSSLDVN